jgi:putative MATE family efflux protein
VNYNSYKSIWILTWPLIISGIGQTLINVTDTFFLGRLGETALGASAISGLYYATFLMLSLGLGSGSQILIARYNGENNPDYIKLFFNQSNLLQLLLSVLLTLFCYFSYETILKLIVSSVEVTNASIDFLKYRFLGFIPIFILCSIRSFFGGIGKTKVISYATLILATLNFILNYLLVFGNFGFPALGIKGSALASSISEWITTLFIIFYTLNYNRKNTAGLYLKFKIDYNALKELIKLSYPLVFQFMISLLSWFIFFLIVEKVSTEYLAVSNLIRNVYMIIMSPIIAFTQSTSTVISHHIGRNEISILKSILKKVLTLSLCFTIVISFVTLVNSSFMLEIFTNQEKLITQGLPILNLVCFALILFSVSVPLLSALSATGSSKISFLIEFITMFLYIGLTYIFAIKLNYTLTGIWSVEVIYFIAIGSSAYYYFNNFIKLKNEIH